MNVYSQPLLVLLIATLGLGVAEGQSDLVASAEGDQRAERRQTTASSESPTTARAADVGTDDDSEDLPVIDFSMLDQVRSLDLIDMEPSFPEFLKELDGRRVSLVGFMAPFDSLRDMRRCMIVPSYVGCKFCSPPKLTQVVYVTQGSDDAHRRSYPFIEPASHVSGILRLSLPESDHEGLEHGFFYSLEDAIVTAHTGKAPTRAPGHGLAPHEPITTEFEPVALTDMVQLVAEIMGREPLVPIEMQPVSAETFGDIVRADLEATFPEATRAARNEAFRLLGLLPEESDLIEALAEFQLSRRVATTDAKGERIYVLDSVPDDHPYVQLDVVGEIADALNRQHYPRDQKIPDSDRPAGGLPESDDIRRAHDALRKGLKTMTVYRYARPRGIPPGARPPAEVVRETRIRRQDKTGIERALNSVELGVWDAVPSFLGTFFVDSLVGDTGPLSGIEPALARPPSTTMEFFRPRWYQDATLWRPEPVPSSFADNILDSAPDLTDVLGIGGLVPLLRGWYSFDVAKILAGGWTGDRWAVWMFPDGESALMLEIRWQDETSAIQFREAIPRDSLWTLPPHRAGSTVVRMLRADSDDVLSRMIAAAQAGP